MTKEQLRKYAKGLLKDALNLDTPVKNIVLLEAAEQAEGVSYLLFRISGINEIEYCMRKTFPSRLDAFSIINRMNNEEMFISYQL